MKLGNSKAFVLVAVGAVGCSVAVAPAIAAKKKTHKVNIKVVKPIPQEGTTIRGDFDGKPFGRCSTKGTLIIPKSTTKYTCKGGTFIMVSVGTTGGANDAKGTWTIKKGSGTGKYKGITGKGTFAGQLSTAIFTYKGTARY